MLNAIHNKIDLKLLCGDWIFLMDIYMLLCSRYITNIHIHIRIHIRWTEKLVSQFILIFHMHSMNVYNGLTSAFM